jgi:hypothetical protein
VRSAGPKKKEHRAANAWRLRLRELPGSSARLSRSAWSDRLSANSILTRIGCAIFVPAFLSADDENIASMSIHKLGLIEKFLGEL